MDHERLLELQQSCNRAPPALLSSRSEGTTSGIRGNGDIIVFMASM
jgi:hypothetical protein